MKGFRKDLLGCRGMIESSLCSVWVLSMLLFLSACEPPLGKPLDGREIPMLHSSLLRIIECDGYTAVEVKNPWGKGLFQRYLLVSSDSALPQELPEGVLLRTPLKRTILFSGVHASLFEELSAIGSVSGVCDARYFYSGTLESYIAQGLVADCGSSLNIDAEKVVMLAPDAIFVLPFENGGYGKLDRMEYPLVECAEYMEASPLGCAEWCRFYARLFEKGDTGDSIFNAVKSAYDSVMSITSQVSDRPKLMCELKSTSAWYMPGGNSTMGRMYADAGADYILAGNESNGSVPLAFETVLGKAADADIWLMKYNSAENKSYGLLASEVDGYTSFAPFKRRNIFACNTRYRNVFEETSFHPELLLKELAAIFHPGLFPDYTLMYYEKMR